MWQTGWREQVWQQFGRPWDVVVIGGGITGAGLLREASRAGLRTLLLEAKDFAFGTSSRSSKLVHGGFRYIRNFQFKVTAESVRERERLLREAPDLVTPLEFIMASRRGDRTAMWKFGLGVLIYDWFGGKWAHGTYTPERLQTLAPALSQAELLGAHWYYDALVDDARLVVRCIREAVAGGGLALNYAPVEKLLTNQAGEVCGVAVRDDGPEGGGRTQEVQARVVISAVGPWTDALRANLGLPGRVRKSRGSHIIFPRHKFPITQSFTLLHPADNRVLFAIPWEGVTLVGTTDLDHSAALEQAQPEPAIQRGEVAYLLEAIHYSFPALGLTAGDITASFAGLRPMVNTGQADPSKESRAHTVLQENGLVTIVGGKLTTYRLMAHQTLEAVRRRLSPTPRLDERQPVFNPRPDVHPNLPVAPEVLARLLGRYGAEAISLLSTSKAGELEPLPELPTLWAELRWAARAEGVAHLDDLLLRRVRLGLLLPNGGLEVMDRIRAIAQPELEWDAARWKQEVARYTALWRQCYYLPPG